MKSLILYCCPGWKLSEAATCYNVQQNGSRKLYIKRFMSSELIECQIKKINLMKTTSKDNSEFVHYWELIIKKCKCIKYSIMVNVLANEGEDGRGYESGRGLCPLVLQDFRATATCKQMQFT